MPSSSKPLLTRETTAILATVAGALALAAGQVQPPASWILAGLALGAAAVAGVTGFQVPRFATGRPIVAAGLIGPLTVGAGLLMDFAAQLPEGAERSVVTAGAVLCVGLAGVPLPQPRSGSGPAALLVLMFLPFASDAGAPRYHTHTLTIASAACPTGSPGLAPDGVEWGISLSGLQGWKVTVCPVAGQTITGTGSLRVCAYSAAPWGPGKWALSPEFSWDMTGKTSTADNPCLELGQLEPRVALSDRVFVYPSADFGVSGGTTVTIYLTGETR